MSRINLRAAGVPVVAAVLGFTGHYFAGRQNQLPPAKPAATSAAPGAQAKDVDLSSASPTAAELARAADDSELAGKTALAQSICGFLQEYEFWPETSDPVTSANPLPCIPKQAAQGGQKQETAAGAGQQPASGKIHVLLAVVPDPVRTHLELRFDRAMDDIEDAAQERGWDFDSDWLPWDSRVHEEPDRYGERLLDQAARRGRERTPGVLLFRPTGGIDPDRQPGEDSPDAPLLVLVAGDSPIAGINADQFRTAMALWRSLRSMNASAGELRILGPSFSGSVQSLIHLLEHEPGSAPPERCGGIGVSVQIASGSITSGGQITQVAKVCQNTQFISFEMDGEYEQVSLMSYLQAKAPGRHVAVLAEQKTAYGSSLVQDNTSVTQKRQRTPHEPTLVLRFPPEISQLREAYEESGVIGFGESGNEPRSQLQFTTTEKPRGTDTIPSFSGNQRNLSIESEMAGLTATLGRERIDIVLLAATDVFDEMFVARYLQQHAPRVTVIIQDSDVLFLRRGQDEGLENTYIASPWPLIPDNQLWTAAAGGAVRDRTIYTSRGDEGARAAALYLLPDKPCSLGEHNCPAPPEYRSPLENPPALSSHPPLWLSIVSRGFFAPVALVDRDFPPASTVSNGVSLPMLPTGGSSPAGLSIAVPLLTKLLLFSIFALLLWHGLACLSSRIDRRFAWSYALADAGQRKHRLCAQACISLMAVPALRLLMISGEQGFSGYPDYVWWVIGPLQFLAVALASWSMGRFWISGKELSGRKLIRPFLVAALVCLLIALALDLGTWPLLMWGAKASERVFLLYRSGLMTPGVSPAFTLLLFIVAFAYWGHSLFARWAFFGHRVPDLPEGHLRDLNCPDRKSTRLVTNLFTTPKIEKFFQRSHWPNYCIAASSFLVVVAAIRISGSWGPRSLENRAFCAVAGVLTILLATAVVYDIAVAAFGWSVLHRSCLLTLKRSPLRWGFNSIKGFSWRRLWTSSYALSPDLVFDYLSRMLEANSRTALYDTYLGDAREALSKLYFERAGPGGEPIKDDDQWSQAVADSLRHLHVVLAVRAEEMLDDLKSCWAADHGPLTGTEEKDRAPAVVNAKLEDGEDSVEALDRMAKEEFVALLYLGYIRMVLIQIRNRVLTAVVCYVLLLWALTSYTWTNHHAIILAMSALLGLISAAVLYIYSGMHRDDILSRMTETEPGKLDPEFFEKTIPTIGLPLLSLVATQFPEFSDLIFSWIEPGLRGH